MQLYARNIMAVTAASAVLAAGVVTMDPVTSDIAAPRTLTADVALVADAACIPGGTRQVGRNLSELSQTFLTLTVIIPAYAVTQAAYLASDVVAVAADAVVVAATYAAAAITGPLSPLNILIAWEHSNIQAFLDNLRNLIHASSVQASVARFNTDLTQLQTDWANTFSAIHFHDFSRPHFNPPGPAVSLRSRPAAALPSRRTESLASRAGAASVTPRQAPSAKAAAASVQVAPTAKQGQRREARGAAHRAERSGTGGIG